MSKYLQFILVIIYVFITISVLYLLWFLLGNGKLQLDDWMVLTIIAGWLFICFSTVYWYTDIHLFFNQVRKPIHEEEQRLIVSMHEVQKKANDNKRYRLRVEESAGLNAYAIGYHTIVVSKDCIKYLSHGELCALLAHEMGHLRTRDCMAVLAFYFANRPPGFVASFFKTGLKFTGGRVKAIARQSLLAALLMLIVLLFILSKSAVLYYLLPIVAFVIFMWLLNVVFSFLWLLNSRYTEYRQDAFAHKLGFGPELKQLLLKILETSPPQPVDQYSILTRSSHPILHNRIRRLEKLSGLRK
jgi:Zn-dependent protease with chaperone function